MWRNQRVGSERLASPRQTFRHPQISIESGQSEAPMESLHYLELKHLLDVDSVWASGFNTKNTSGITTSEKKKEFIFLS